MSEDFYRHRRLPPYVIAEVNAMRAAARQAGRDIIDSRHGQPGSLPPQHVIDKLCEAAQSRAATAIRSPRAFRAAQGAGELLRPPLPGSISIRDRSGGHDGSSKEGLASLATAITAPGDVVLAPNPSYPIHMFGFIIAGATIRSVPTTPDENYWRALDRAMASTVPRPSVLVVGYPSEP